MFVSIAVGAAVLPCTALAAPTITITTPESGKAYTKGAAVTVAYSCSADAVSCVGTIGSGNVPAANGSALDTSTVGQSYITVTAKDAGNATSVAQAVYSIVEGGGDPGGQVPATLNLVLGTPTAFSPFVPGLTKDYLATLNAQILSTAGDATLTVNDASATNVGKLVNGTFPLPTPVQAGAVKVPDTGPTPAPSSYAPLGGAATPTPLLTYDGPVSGSAAITFKQAINQADALRTGSYSKTLTFTLSTTNP
ncbi:hypothetical protein OJ997_14470 [Solirubrobacter phytolaccae]|uniref:WxL domain-containing protein n=1 Tax=Solirubrobacter phytolaccae TaxID=1404360 RepID=A0A9X3S9I5_9ACTN|nr:hypothetical protein [Solirubrobacter phytolaccae]MDA0181506.1 hypothetical protein [Solirubrobacter phytolaccae]